MKLRQWLYGATALAMLAACSDHDGLKPDGPADEGGDGYVGIKIQLPTVPSTRANDDFSDGVESEYAIEDAVLLIFQGDNMTDATCTGVFNLKNSDPVADKTNDQITRKVTRVANVSGIKGDKKVYGLVMVNAITNGLLQSANLNDPKVIGQKIQGLQELVTEKQLFQQTTKGKGFAKNIFMTNSPLSEKAGGTTDPGTIQGALPVLVLLDGTTYPTEQEALKNPAGTIHVERSVGKITCSTFGKDTDVTVNIDGVDYKLTVKSLSWDMAQDMANSYVVRNTNRTPAGEPFSSTKKLWRWDYASENITDTDLGAHRMIGHTKLTENDNYFRPYFCQVPGYGVEGNDANSEKKTFVKTTMQSGDAKALSFNADGTLSLTNAFYPRENTFPVDYMKYANTTRIGFWVEFEFVNANDATKTLPMDKKNFYISGADKSTLYLDDAKGNDPLTNKVLAALQDEAKYPAVKDAVMAAVNTEKKGSIKMEDLGNLLDIKYASELEPTDEKYAKDGEVRIVEIKFKDISDAVYHDTYEGVFAQAPEFDFSSILTNLNNLGDFYRYTGGKVFYEVRIKHFGDDLTPWSVADGAVATTIDESYSTDAKRDANYLGRYGIVRNNWYDLNITKITKLGYPEDPAAWEESWPGKPDDNLDQYIAVELRLLSWAKRTQEHTF